MAALNSRLFFLVTSAQKQVGAQEAGRLVIERVYYILNRMSQE